MSYELLTSPKTSHNFHLSSQRNRTSNDIDFVQELINTDIEHNRHFKEDHDIDFNVPEMHDDFFECVESEDELPQFERQQMKVNTGRYNLNFGMRENQQQSRKISGIPILEHDEEPNEEPNVDNISVDSLDEDFICQAQDDSDIRTYRLDQQKTVTIYTLKHNYFEQNEDKQLLLKNVEILKQKSGVLEPFYLHLKSLQLHKKGDFNIMKYAMLKQFLDALNEVVEKFENMYQLQEKWLEMQPNIQVAVRIQGFSYQLERFLSQIKALTENAQQRHSRVRSQLKEDSLKKKDMYTIDCLGRTQLLEVDEDRIESPLISIIQFKAKALMLLYDEFTHLKINSSRYRQFIGLLNKIKSRYKVYKMFKDKTQIQYKIRQHSQRQVATYQATIAEQYFQLQSNDKLKNISLIINVRENTKCCYTSRLNFIKKSRQIKTRQQSYLDYAMDDDCINHKFVYKQIE